jgi:hypothetical protein
MSKNLRYVLFGVAGVIVIVLIVQAFGGGSSSTKDTTTSKAAAAKAWAGGVCVAFTTWKTDLAEASHALKTNPSKAGLHEASLDAQNATTKLKNTLHGIGGPPSTNSSEAAQSAVQTLQTQLHDGVDSIQKTVQGASGVQGSAEAVSSVSATLSTMRDQLKAAGTTLRSLPGGELEQAFTTAPACTKEETS